MSTFALEERDLAWVDRAPVVITKTFTLVATTTEVFDRLADLPAWSEWCGGMKKVRIDGAASGVGTLRTVWVGATRVQERFVLWGPGHRLTFTLTGSNTPGPGSAGCRPDRPHREGRDRGCRIPALVPGPGARHHGRTPQGRRRHHQPIPPALNDVMPHRQ
jgi:hypothetical protein